MTARTLVACPIPGCETRTTKRAMRAHAKIPHVRCTCDWVGVSLSQHRSQRIKAAQAAASDSGVDPTAAGHDERRRHAAAGQAA